MKHTTYQDYKQATAHVWAYVLLSSISISNVRPYNTILYTKNISDATFLINT